MTWTVPFGNPVVPDVNSSTETAIRSRRTGSSCGEPLAISSPYGR